MAEGDSNFGFKDMEKALETLKLLESHDMQYRKLTVRGLLGRAKRVLTMTKAEEKLKNINAAIGVFEKWLEENGGGASSKNAKTDSEDKVETVPGLGFKDKAAAEATLSICGTRSGLPEVGHQGINWQLQACPVRHQNEDKITAIKEGVQVLEDFLEKFEAENRIKDNRAYLPLAVVTKLPDPKDELAKEFLEAYGGSKAKGNYKHLRTMFPKADDKTSWDIVRNRQLSKLLEQIKSEEAKLFDTETGAPTDLHLQLIHWAYSPQPDKLKQYIEKLAKKTPEKRKQESSSSASDSSATSQDSDGKDKPKRKKKREE
ncbi:GD18271 [Drosophila simulans]|uniref:GD18271 n=1 Tax=Drosophila simulans TaxID=7240 RepID=B4QTS4_DROSI|nr:GD18271 [Drosophila simulans]